MRHPLAVLDAPRRIDLHEAQRRFDAALAATPERTALRARALLRAAAIDFRSDRFPQRRAIPGVAYWILGEAPRAEELVGESVELFRALTGLVRADHLAGQISEIRASPADGQSGLRMVFEDMLQPFPEISCDAALGYALANQAGLVSARGDLASARALLDQSGTRFADSGDERGTAAVLVRRAYLELAEGDLAAARLALDEALELRAGQGDRRGLALVLAGLGLIDTTAGEYASAERHLAEAREMFRRAGDRALPARSGEPRTSRSHKAGSRTARAHCRKPAVLGVTGRERWITNTLAGLAEVALLRGDLQRACALFADARDRYATRDDAPGVADVEEPLRGLC